MERLPQTVAAHSIHLYLGIIDFFLIFNQHIYFSHYDAPNSHVFLHLTDCFSVGCVIYEGLL